VLEEVTDGVGVREKQENKVERSALDIAEAEVKKLRSELRGRETDLAESREECRKLKAQMESERAALEKERADFRASSAKEAADLKEASRKSGRDEGLAQGYSEGISKAEEEKKREYEGRFSQTLSLLQNISSQLAESRENLAKSHAPQLIRLWEAMLGKMLFAGVSLDGGAVMRVVENMLKRISDRERIIVYLNPADLSMIEGSKEKLIDSIRGVNIFELLSDEHVDKGSCLIETNLGIYDARWRTQLEQVSSEVENLLMEVMAADVSGGGG
jgi:flagellar assembly protein FliH